MSEYNLGSKLEKGNSEDNGEEKRKRRPRSDEEGRNFSCSCGKSYLSYPALYTHIKTKHNGKAEYNRAALPKDEQEEEPKEDDQPEDAEKAEDHKNMETLKRYLNKFFPFTHREKEAERKVRDLSREDQLYVAGIREYWEKHKKED